MKIFYNLFVIILFSNFTFGQDQSKMILQNQYNGGVCTVGFDIIGWGYSASTQTIPFFIEPNSTISKAYMVYNILNNLDTLTYKLKINNQTFNLTQSDITQPFYYIPNTSLGATNTHTGIIDCTQAFSSNTSPIILQLPSQNFGIPVYRKLFFIIEYTNSALPLINYAVYINEENIKQNHSFILNNRNKIDTAQQISLGLINQGICSATDSYDISINNTFIGNIHSGDQINNGGYCTGASAHFYHQNNTSFGLDDDTPDVLMDSTDALANIQPYLTNPNSFSIQYNYQPDNGNDALSNSPIAMILAYTPDCDATALDVPITDYTICKNEGQELIATGGVRYKWEPSTGLSATNIANPICTAQKDTWYTCTLFTADSCSKTIPVFVRVVDEPTLTVLATQNDTCGNQTGKIISEAVGNLPLTYSINNGTAQNNGLFNNLTSGNYNLVVTDANGCKIENNTTVFETIAVNAQFTATPNIGTTPTEVEFINQSTDATNYVWYVETDTFYTQNANYTFTDTGNYNISLIAYNQTPNCADTAHNLVTIVPPINITIPNVFTPNNDQINDVFSINIEGADAINCKILNRWGTVVYEFEKAITPNQQTLNIWDAITNTDQLTTDGTYFYIIAVHSPAKYKEVFTGTVNVFGN